MNNHSIIKYAKYSLAFLWISTGVISAFISPDIGFEILGHAGINGVLAKFFVYGGSLVDALLGIWILSDKYVKICCWLQILVIVSYTLLLTIIDASFWIHPFAPLVKNLPILILIWFVIENTKQALNNLNSR